MTDSENAKTLFQETMRTIRQATVLQPEETLADHVARLHRHILANREALMMAFIAETGLRPSECELIEEVQRPSEDGIVRTIVTVRKRGL